MRIEYKMLIVFILSIFINISYVYYVKAIENNKCVLASLWASFTNLSTGLAAFFYVQNVLILIPSFLGAFIGTYIGFKIKK